MAIRDFMTLGIGGRWQIQPDFAVTKLVTPKKTPARLELRRVGVMALLWLGVLRLFDGFGMSDLARQAFVTV